MAHAEPKGSQVHAALLTMVVPPTGGMSAMETLPGVDIPTALTPEAGASLPPASVACMAEAAATAPAAIASAGSVALAGPGDKAGDTPHSIAPALPSATSSNSTDRASAVATALTMPVAGVVSVTPPAEAMPACAPSAGYLAATAVAAPVICGAAASTPSPTPSPAAVAAARVPVMGTEAILVGDLHGQFLTLVDIIEDVLRLTPERLDGAARDPVGQQPSRKGWAWKNELAGHEVLSNGPLRH